MKLAIKVMVLAGMSLLVAQTINANSLTGKLGLSGNMGYSNYTLGYWNDFFSFADFNQISGGLTYNGTLQYGIMDNLLVGISINHLTAGSKNGEEVLGIAKLNLNYTFPAMEYGLFVKGCFPLGDVFLLTSGIEIDYLFVHMKISTQSDDPALSPLNNEFNGQSEGFGYKLLAGGEYFIIPQLSLGLDLGYRFAITTVTTKDEYTMFGGVFEDTNCEYSGFFMQGGFRVYF